jgi:hypothetical protein
MTSQPPAVAVLALVGILTMAAAETEVIPPPQGQVAVVVEAPAVQAATLVLLLGI